MCNSIKSNISYNIICFKMYNIMRYNMYNIIQHIIL